MKQSRRPPLVKVEAHHRILLGKDQAQGAACGPLTKGRLISEW